MLKMVRTEIYWLKQRTRGLFNIIERKVKVHSKKKKIYLYNLFKIDIPTEGSEEHKKSLTYILVCKRLYKPKCLTLLPI